MSNEAQDKRWFAQLTHFPWEGGIVYLAVMTDGTAWESYDGGAKWREIQPPPAKETPDE